jgi:hypothetical protein
MANLISLRNQALHSMVNSEAFKVADAFVNDPAAVATVALAGGAITFAGVMALPEIGGWVVKSAGPPAAKWVAKKVARAAALAAITEGASFGTRKVKSVAASFREDNKGSTVSLVLTGLSEKSVNRIIDKAADELHRCASEVLDHIKILN